MIEELQAQIIKKLVEINKIEFTEKSEEFIKGNFSIIPNNSGEESQELKASLVIDCLKLPKKSKMLSYCVCIYANVSLNNKTKLEIVDFWVQEQVGISLGIPVHGNPIINSDQILLVLLTLNEELQNKILSINDFDQIPPSYL